MGQPTTNPPSGGRWRWNDAADTWEPLDPAPEPVHQAAPTPATDQPLSPTTEP